MSVVVVRSYKHPGRLMPRAERGLRARSVRLWPGQVMPWHSTKSREELVLVIEGRVRLDVRGARSGRVRQRAVREGSFAFLPAHTPHQVVNTSRRAARYVYVTGAA